MTIWDEYLRMGGPVPDGWHFNASHFEHHLYEKGKILFTVTDIACQQSKRSPQMLYGIARGVISMFSEPDSVPKLDPAKETAQSH